MIRAVVLVASFLAIAAIFASAFSLSPFPVAGTTFFAGAVVIESGAVLWLVRASPPRSLWFRATAAALLGMVALWFSAQDTLGAPEYVFMHQRWLAALIIGCLGLAIASAVARVRGRHAA
jgi:hypothetical protein